MITRNKERVIEFLKTIHISRFLLLINLTLSIVYFSFILVFFPIASPVLFALLILSELFHILQVVGYIHTVWPRKRIKRFSSEFRPEVAVYITICGEPKEIIEQTIKAALAMDYPTFSIYLLNDGLVAKRPNWQEAEDLARQYGVTCITRKKPGGAKAGNINNALRKTKEPFVVVFDADHEPKTHFLTTTVGYFIDEQVAYVQSPQYYKNNGINQVTGGAWEQQALFFGPLLKGKDTVNASFMCGTNMIIRRIALEQAGGMSEQSIAEDFLTSILIHNNKWRSVYVDEVLAEGLAPEDFLSYYKQQFRWARGSLEVLFRYNPFRLKGLRASQKMQYLNSASYYVSGVIVFINILLPLFYFYFGLQPLAIGTMTLALIFLPYIFFVVYTLQLSSNFTYTFRALSFGMSSFPIYVKALWHTIRKHENGFAVTSKTRLTGSYRHMVWPHLLFIVLAVIGVAFGIVREGLSASMLSNIAWAILYVAIFVPFIQAAFEHEPKQVPVKKTVEEKASV